MLPIIQTRDDSQAVITTFEHFSHHRLYEHKDVSESLTSKFLVSESFGKVKFQTFYKP